ncbi:MAG: polyprenyl synthetase family protein [Acidobacteriota bacterium]
MATTTANISAYLNEKVELINSELDQYLQKESHAPDSIIEIMRYSVFSGGKRIRPILSIASCEALGGKLEYILPSACAIELIHTYSLIHDDLPSMDNDDLRRGKPTAHRAFSEAMAILAGDALLTLAFEIMSRYPDGEAFNRNKIEIIRTIASACGIGGLIGGQVMDIQSEGRDIEPNECERLHQMKTGALIGASLTCGAIMSGTDEERKRLISDFGKKVGLAFQITDDLLDAEGKKEVVGKQTRKDILKKKATYPSLYGIDGAHQIAQRLIEEGKELLKPLGERSSILSSLADFIIKRRS